ncbi:MAG: transposase [Desulfobacterales bacterium]
MTHMPRQARIDAHGALHHIIIRGIERKAIFEDDRDREDFIDRLSDPLQEMVTPCYAWALMSNHVHLLLRTGAVPITSVMRRLLTGHAVRFNRRHRRHGHLFQNRYKSILCKVARRFSVDRSATSRAIGRVNRAPIFLSAAEAIQKELEKKQQ